MTHQAGQNQASNERENNDIDNTTNIPGVVAEIPTSDTSSQDDTVSGPAGAADSASTAVGTDNLAGGTSQHISDGTTGMGKGS